MTFADREEHLRQRAARGWVDDEDVRVCVEEVDRLTRLLEAEMADHVTCDQALDLALAELEQ